MAASVALVMVTMSAGPRVSRSIMRWNPLWGHSSLAELVAASLFTPRKWILTGSLASERYPSSLTAVKNDLTKLGSTWYTAM
eukprot:6762624-Heterocapsa_arctica.AAC.1